MILRTKLTAILFGIAVFYKYCANFLLSGFQKKSGPVKVQFNRILWSTSES